jgi:hypothetical protein
MSTYGVQLDLGVLALNRAGNVYIRVLPACDLRILDTCTAQPRQRNFIRDKADSLADLAGAQLVVVLGERAEAASE